VSDGVSFSVLKNNQFEINNSISQIKISIESLANRVEQVENRISETEGKVEEFDQTVKDHKRMLRKYEWNMQDIWDTMKRPNMGVEGEDIQAKVIHNIFNGIITKKFPNLEKERVIHVQGWFICLIMLNFT
jgi:methyl-accepting chemotaxis protein